MTRAVIRPLLAAAVLAAGAALAGCEDYPPPPPRYGPPPPPGYRAHVRRCFYFHPNYDPRSNTFIGRDGYPHVCDA